jgi:predicted dehydrogenase
MCLAWLPKIAWDPKRYFNRFAYWDFSTGGQTGGLFVHMIDVVHWYLGLTRAASAVALGGIYRYPDGRDTADNINAIVTYPKNLNVTFEASITDMVGKQSADIVFLGTGGRLHIFRGGYRFIPKDAKAPEITAPGTPEGAHMKNWLDCIRTRKDPAANVEDGHFGAMACHMINMAYKARTRVDWKPEWSLQG